MNTKMLIGCHVSIAGGVWNAPKNAHDFGCETFQIFTRSPQGGPAPKLDEETVGKFKAEMEKYDFDQFVVHCPYFVNFGSDVPRIYHGSSSVVRQELERSSLLGASYLMTHLGSAKVLGQEKAFEQTKKGLVKVLEGYEGTTQFLLEIAAGAGEIIGDSFEELAELMEPLVKYKAFGGICFDTQHAFSSGYDLRTPEVVKETFEKFDKVIGLKYLKMSHINDSKVELGGRKDRHEHIGEGMIGQDGFRALLQFLQSNLKSKISNLKSGGALPLILETEHDKVKTDIDILKSLRETLKK
jgi:deoxyribonuclease-4